MEFEQLNLGCRFKMRKKRKGEELEPAAGPEKRAKKGEDPSGKFLSLVAAEDTVMAGWFS